MIILHDFQWCHKRLHFLKIFFEVGTVVVDTRLEEFQVDVESAVIRKL